MPNHEDGELLSAHEVRTERVATQVQSFYKRQEPFRIYHGGTNSTRRRKYDPSTVIDTSDFVSILSVDRAKRVAIVEPNVSMEALVDATLPFGLVPPVVMEFPAITVGGGFAGGSGESSSFRHGFFESTIDRVEIVLGDGRLVFASRHENHDLFRGVCGSFGTLGVITMLEVQLVDAKPYVELQYWPVSTASDAVRNIETHTDNEEVQYLDGIMFAKDSGLLMTGRMVDLEPSNSHLSRQQYRRPWDPWFFLRAKEILETSQKGYTELIPLKDYLFRYDRGAFWAGSYCFDYFLTPFNRFTRWALDDLLHTKVMYKALHMSGLANQYIVQDIGFPYEKVPEFIDYLDRDFGHYPLWLCPLRVKDHASLFPILPPYKTRADDDTKLLNIGVWGPGPKTHARFVDANRGIERETKRLGGLKCLYAHAYYTEQEFWSIYDKDWYHGLRDKYNAGLIPSVFEKVTNNSGNGAVDGSVAGPVSWQRSAYEHLMAMWPVRGVYGALSLLSSRDPDLPISGVHVFLFLPFFLILVVWSLFGKVLSYPLSVVSGNRQGRM